MPARQPGFTANLRECIGAIQNAYENGGLIVNLAKQYGCTPDAIMYWRRKQQWREPAHDALPKSKPGWKLNPKEKTQAVRLRGSGWTIARIATKYDVSPRAIGRLLERRKRGALPRSARHAARWLPCNESAFDVVTPESAYWIGFLMADGCVRLGRDIAVVLQARDAFHLFRLKKFLGAASKVRWYTRKLPAFGGTRQHREAALRVASQKLVSALARFGVGERKSLTAEVVGLEDNRDFWRGVVDGDGTIHIGKASHGQRYRAIFSLCGSTMMLGQFKAWAARRGCRIGTIHRTGKIAYARAYGADLRRVVQILYEQAPIALPRKQMAAEAVMAWRTIRKRGYAGVHADRNTRAADLTA